MVDQGHFLGGQAAGDTEAASGPMLPPLQPIDLLPSCSSARVHDVGMFIDWHGANHTWKDSWKMQFYLSNLAASGTHADPCEGTVEGARTHMGHKCVL